MAGNVAGVGVAGMAGMGMPVPQMCLGAPPQLGLGMPQLGMGAGMQQMSPNAA